MQGNPAFMQQAIRLATENVTSGRGGPFGAVVVRDGKVIDFVSIGDLVKFRIERIEEEADAMRHYIQSA